MFNRELYTKYENKFVSQINYNAKNLKIYKPHNIKYSKTT